MSRRRDYPSKHELAQGLKSGLKSGDLRDCAHLRREESREIRVLGHYSLKCDQDSFSSWTDRNSRESVIDMVSCPKDCTYFEDWEEAEQERKLEAKQLAASAAARAQLARRAEAAKKRRERIEKLKAVPVLILRSPFLLLKTMLQPLDNHPTMQVVLVIMGGAALMLYLFRSSPELIQLMMELLKKLPW